MAMSEKPSKWARTGVSVPMSPFAIRKKTEENRIAAMFENWDAMVLCAGRVQGIGSFELQGCVYSAIRLLERRCFISFRALSFQFLSSEFMATKKSRPAKSKAKKPTRASRRAMAKPKPKPEKARESRRSKPTRA